MNESNAAEALSQDSVFLSVIIYHSCQGTQLLNETLLMLSGQTCPDFEVIVAGPISETPDDNAVRSLIDSFSPLLSKKTSLIPFTGRIRAETLNHALEHAKGRMVSFIDEGDLPFDNWVECLRETAPNDQCIAYAYAIEQVWEIDTTKSEGCVLRSVGELDSSSCHPFSILDSITKPEFQGTSFAFPANGPKEQLLRFDETLRTLERWDYLLRSLSTYPLVTFDQPASLSRVWRQPADPSMRPTIWDKTLPLPNETEEPEEACRTEYEHVIEHLAALTPQVGYLYDPYAPTLNESYYLSQQAFMRQCTLTCHPAGEGEPFIASPDIGHRTAWTLRFTPDRPAMPLDHINLAIEDTRGCITVSNFICAIEDTQGTEHQFELTSCQHNGLQIDCSHVVFLIDQPTLTLRFTPPIVPACIHFKLKGHLGVEENCIDQFTRGNISLWFGRMKRWALRHINRL